MASDWASLQISDEEGRRLRGYSGDEGGEYSRGLERGSAPGDEEGIVLQGVREGECWGGALGDERGTVIQETKESTPGDGGVLQGVRERGEGKPLPE